MVMWAQRPNLIFLTVCLEDTKDPQIEVDTEKLYFKAVGGPEKKVHEVTINFHGEIDKEVGKFCKIKFGGQKLSCDKLIYLSISLLFFNYYYHYSFTEIQIRCERPRY